MYGAVAGNAFKGPALEIRDSAGRPLAEVQVNLSAEEATELLVAASQIDEGASTHALMRDPAGNTLTFYLANEDAPPLQKGTDWWVGPILLLAVILVVVGAFTIARGILGLLF